MSVKKTTAIAYMTNEEYVMERYKASLVSVCQCRLSLSLFISVGEH